MDQRARTITVLACLAGAMTGTASLLAWMDPSIPPPPEPLSHHQLEILARSLVNDAVVIEPNIWHRVEVVADPGLTQSGTWLAARAETSQSHFFIDDTGRPTRASLPSFTVQPLLRATAPPQATTLFGSAKIGATASSTASSTRSESASMDAT